MEYPSWLIVKSGSLKQQANIEKFLRKAELNTVCENARCPNLCECFNRKTATFLILGNVCTRNCRFCAISKGLPSVPDPEEPSRLAEAVIKLGLRYVVITSVTRDDLADGGASQFSLCIQRIRVLDPTISVEILIPDFQGSMDSLKTVVSAKPSVLNHNIETVPRLYSEIRIKADYDRSLNLLRAVKEMDERMKTKTGIMLGLGETDSEVLQTMQDIRATGCDIITIGQYLSPGKEYISVKRFVEPERFKWFELKARELGFAHAACSPLVRSSYHADEYFIESNDNVCERNDIIKNKA